MKSTLSILGVALGLAALITLLSRNDGEQTAKPEKVPATKSDKSVVADAPSLPVPNTKESPVASEADSRDGGDEPVIIGRASHAAASGATAGPSTTLGARNRNAVGRTNRSAAGNDKAQTAAETAAGSAAYVEIDLSSEAARAETVTRLYAMATLKKEEAIEFAQQNGLSVREETADGETIELMEIRDGMPLFNITTNANAAISTGADKLRNTAPYNVNGLGMTVGVWDGGAVRSTHQEFGGRVTILDGASNSNHATHVAGTIGAGGATANAKGSAPSVNISSYDWNSDEAEMTSKSGVLPVSNHSYGLISGWRYDSKTKKYSYYGQSPEREDRKFGMYDSTSRTWDDIVFKSGTFLPFKSAGNDRNDNAPPNGTSYYDASTQTNKTYNPSTGPYADGYDNGFDTIGGGAANAKNIVTVGAANDAVSGGTRNPAAGTITSFSGFGPTDDGRIKPDLVANGASLYSPTAGSNSAYSTYSGTSMASPNAAGAAILLQELYSDNFNKLMKASTLKGLLIHTADDIGNPGPDYTYGWGYLDAKDSADLIRSHKTATNAGGKGHLLEDAVSSNGNKEVEMKSTGSQPLRVTLCWTDRPGTAKNALDSSTPDLVNNLNLKVIDPNGNTHYPFKLNPSNPSANATKGVNNLDNVEQVLISNPVAGTYRAIVEAGSLTGGSQSFSLILSEKEDSSGSATPSGPGLTSPTPGSKLAGSSATFEWNAGGVNANLWHIYVGNSVGAYDIASKGTTGTARSMVLTGLPTDGRKLHVRLWYHDGANWHVVDDYEFEAAGSAPKLVSPAPGSKLPGSTVTFKWTGGVKNLWHIYVGNSKGAYDVASKGAAGTASSMVVTGLPTDGRTLHVRLWFYDGANWHVVGDYEFEAAGSPPKLVSPTPGSKLSGSNVSFGWSSGGVNAQYWYIYVGNSAGAYDIASKGTTGTARSMVLGGLPTDGRTLHVRLWFYDGASWHVVNDYQYKATGSAPKMTSPTPGTRLPGSSATFGWSRGGVYSQYWYIYVGTRVGAYDVATNWAYGSASSMLLTGLPRNGRTLYVRLWYYDGANWKVVDDYQYKASL